MAKRYNHKYTKESPWLSMTLDTGTGRRQVSVRGLYSLPGLIMEELKKNIHNTGTLLLRRLKFEFEKASREDRIHDRERNPDYPWGLNMPLRTRLMKSYIQQVLESPDELRLLVFDLEHASVMTSNEGRKTYRKGWFLRFADGHTGRRHGSAEYGFISHRLAMQLAEQAANTYIGDEQKRQEWLAEMDEAFQGRHQTADDSESGIMVKLDEPLFFMIPEFGNASEFVSPHPGYRSWPAISTVGREMRQRNGPVIPTVFSAFQRAAERVK